MSVPVSWEDSPSTATPLNAATLNAMQAYFAEARDAAVAAKEDAEAAAASVLLPTDTTVANLIGSASETQTAGDARWLLPAAADAAYVHKGELVYDVRSYGAVGDGTTDDTAAIQATVAAIQAAGGGVMFLPKGTFRISDTITITGRVSIQGVGSDGSDLDVTPTSVNATSVIKWMSTNVTKPMLDIVGLTGGMVWSNFVIDGRYDSGSAYLAAYGIRGNEIVRCLFQNIAINSCATGIKLYTTNTSNNQNTMFNTFVNTNIGKVGVGIELDGNGSFNANTCHNSFINTTIDRTGAHGIWLRDCDNNHFSMTFNTQRSGSGNSLTMDDHARSNYFFHYQAAGPVVANPGSSNTIYGYDRENGQAAPTLAGGSLTWTETNNNATGWYVTVPVAQRTIDTRYQYSGRMLQSTWVNITALSASATVTCEPSGATASVGARVTPLDMYVIAMTVALSSAMTAGALTFNVLDNGAVVWSNTATYPTGNNRYLRFNLAESAAIKLFQGHTYSVQIVASGTIAPTGLKAVVDLFYLV